MFFCVLTTDSYMVLCVAKRNSMYHDTTMYCPKQKELARAQLFGGRSALTQD